jgi:hypothetical protein
MIAGSRGRGTLHRGSGSEMQITCPGHAGLHIQTSGGTILRDPWKNPAYFGSWFVFPDNRSGTRSPRSGSQRLRAWRECQRGLRLAAGTRRRGAARQTGGQPPRAPGPHPHLEPRPTCCEACATTRPSHNQHRPQRSRHGAAPLKPLPEPVDLARYRVRRQARVGGPINEYHLVARHGGLFRPSGRSAGRPLLR